MTIKLQCGVEFGLTYDFYLVKADMAHFCVELHCNQFYEAIILNALQSL